MAIARTAARARAEAELERQRTDLSEQIETLEERLRQGDQFITNAIRRGAHEEAARLTDHWCKLLQRYEHLCNLYLDLTEPQQDKAE